MNNKIAIILTTIERPLALKKSVESIASVWQDNWILLIGNQNKFCDESTYQILDEITNKYSKIKCHSYDLPYNCGISYARNYLICMAAIHNCEYTLLTSDSIMFDESMKDIQMVALGMDIEQYKLCGLNLNNRIPWEADLNLILEQSFELDFIDPREKLIKSYVPCRIVRNFWIARTDALLKVPYDDNLIMCEHEDFFWKMKVEGLAVCCTNLCSGTYDNLYNTSKYNEIRETNFRIGKQRLMEKYNLKQWVTYKHIERLQK